MVGTSALLFPRERRSQISPGWPWVISVVRMDEQGSGHSSASPTPSLSLSLTSDGPLRRRPASHSWPNLPMSRAERGSSPCSAGPRQAAAALPPAEAALEVPRWAARAFLGRV